MLDMFLSAFGVSEAELKALVKGVKEVDWKNLFFLTDVYTARSPAGFTVGNLTRAAAQELRDNYGWTLTDKSPVCKITWSGPDPSDPKKNTRMEFWIPLLPVVRTPNEAMSHAP